MLNIPWLSDGLENIPAEEGLDLNKLDWLLLLLLPEENKLVDFIAEDEEIKGLLLFLENKLFNDKFEDVIVVLNKLLELLFYIGLEVVEGDDEFAALLNREFEFIFKLFFD